MDGALLSIATLGNIYKVMQLTTDDYELYYTKEVDGFDGEGKLSILETKSRSATNDAACELWRRSRFLPATVHTPCSFSLARYSEPIEIRGVRHCWWLNGMKVMNKSCALAEINKIVVLIEGEVANEVQRVRYWSPCI